MISILQFSLIIDYPVSYNVDKAYKVILGLNFGSAWTKTSFDRMRKTRHVTFCACVASYGIGTFRVGSLFAWYGNVVFCFRKTSSIFQVRYVAFVGIIVLFKCMEAGFLTLAHNYLSLFPSRYGSIFCRFRHI